MSTECPALPKCLDTDRGQIGAFYSALVGVVDWWSMSKREPQVECSDVLLPSSPHSIGTIHCYMYCSHENLIYECRNAPTVVILAVCWESNVKIPANMIFFMILSHVTITSSGADIVWHTWIKLYDFDPLIQPYYWPGHKSQVNTGNIK